MTAWWQTQPWRDLAFPGQARAAQYYDAGWWRSQTFLDDLTAAVRDRPGHPAILAFEQGELARSLTYHELGALVRRFAAALLELGAGPGSVVVLYMPNRWQLSALYLACSRIGAVASPVFPTLDVRELTHVLEASRAEICVTVGSWAGADYAERLAQAASPTLKHQVIIGGQSGLDFESFFENTPWEERHDLAQVTPSGPDEPWLILNTSGTTGRMKRVVHSQNTLYAAIRAESIPLGLGQDDVILIPHFLAHMAGGTYGCFMPVMLGATSVLVDPNTDMDFLVDVIEAREVTYLYAAPAYLTGMLGAQHQRHRDTASLRHVVTGSAPVRPELLSAVRDAFGSDPQALWGMTENGCVTVTRHSDPPGWAAHSDGSPGPGMEIRVLPDEDRSGGGPLLVRGASQCLGYLGQPEEYAACVDADGWFSTGDIASDDGRGGIRILGRRTDLISLASGLKVPVLEVESVLLTHPDVHDVVLVAYPDPEVPGAELAAAVLEVPKPLKPLTLADLRAHLEQARMSRSVWPQRVVYMRALPRNSLGKVQRTELRRRFEIAASRTR